MDDPNDVQREEFYSELESVIRQEVMQELADDEAWKRSQTTLFLSYASEDRESVKIIYDKLVDAGFNPWMDKKDLLAGQDWDKAIRKQIRASDFVLLFFSTTSVAKRGYVQREFKFALDIIEELPEGQVVVIPLRLDDCKVPSDFAKYHIIDMYAKDGFNDLVRALTELNVSKSANQNPLALNEEGEVERQLRWMKEIQDFQQKRRSFRRTEEGVHSAMQAAEEILTQIRVMAVPYKESGSCHVFREDLGGGSPYHHWVRFYACGMTLTVEFRIPFTNWLDGGNDHSDACMKVELFKGVKGAVSQFFESDPSVTQEKLYYFDLDRKGVEGWKVNLEEENATESTVLGKKVFLEFMQFIDANKPDQ